MRFFVEKTNDPADPSSMSAKIVRGDSGVELIEMSMVVDNVSDANIRLTFYTNGINEFYCFLGNHPYGKFIEALDDEKVAGLDKDIEKAWPKFYSAWRSTKMRTDMNELKKVLFESKDCIDSIEGALNITDHYIPRLVLFDDFPNQGDLSWCTCITINGSVSPGDYWETAMPLIKFSGEMIYELGKNDLGSKYRMLGYAKAAFVGLYRGYRLCNVFDSLSSVFCKVD